jgi:putative ubiquitin-RnfH superfamily antitoxin RatB of RatAB toxin-antitoxin module
VNGALVTVTVVYAPAARQVCEVTLTLPVGSTVRAAIDASGLLARFPDIDLCGGAVSVWGRKAPPGQPLRERDRVEICRPLRVDPKLARRERFNKQGARAAGLFAGHRPGAKPGY